jgi:hypothetical protein
VHLATLQGHGGTQKKKHYFCDGLKFEKKIQPKETKKHPF